MAKDCLQQSGFRVTADGKLHPDPEAVHQFSEFLINLSPHARGDNGQPTPQGRVRAAQHASQLLATWGLMDGPRLPERDKMALLASMRFGKGGKSTRYGDARWSAPAREEALLADFGFERDVPISLQRFVAFLLAHGLSGSLHRKPATCGCREAVQYRVQSTTGQRGVHLHQEVKTLLLKGNLCQMDTPIFVALHMPADKYADMQRVRQGLSTHHLANLVLSDRQRIDTEVARALGLDAGRLNMLSLETAAQERALRLIHLCDEALVFASPRRVYTNTGLNTWGIELFDITQFIKSMQARATGRYLPGHAVPVQTIIIAPITQDAQFIAVCRSVKTL
jgi:hypothetical protein